VHTADVGVFLGLIERVGPGIQDLDGTACEHATADHRPLSREDLNVALDLLVFRH
jgi:hypothetical protein